MQTYFFILYFFTYGFFGWCTEVAYAATQQRKFVNRGFLNGPICPVYGIGVGVVVQFLTPFENNLFLLYITSIIVVTVIEGLTGYLMDKLFHHKWWDYTNQPLNIGGYVCLLFSLAWGVACVIIVKVIHPFIHKVLAWIPVKVGIALSVLLGMILVVDIVVTVSAVLKLNRRLEAMEKIAAELREFSDKVGENIYENVMETMEFQEEAKKQLDSAALELREKLETVSEEQKARMAEQKERITEQKNRMAEQKARIEELKTKYAELAGRSTRVSIRLVKAFPKMESRHHKEIMEELKLRVKKNRK